MTRLLDPTARKDFMSSESEDLRLLHTNRFGHQEAQRTDL